MNKYVMLMNFTEKGVAHIQQSPDRAEAFMAAARKLGAKVEMDLWTIGPFDGVAIVEAPDDETMSAVVLSVAKLGNVKTCTMRGYDIASIRKIIAKVP